MPAFSRILGVAAALGAAVAAPYVIADAYLIRVLILAGLFVVLALSYDLVVGQAGALSLAHPAFYGIGAYAVAILVVNYGVGFFVAFLIAGAVSFLAAILIGIPSFRLSGHSFAIGTLGMAWVLQLVANNWIELTNGPMCVIGVPPIELTVAGMTIGNASLEGAYYGVVLLAAATYFLLWAINTSRVGRALHAIRENEVLGEMQGVDSLFYKLLAFSISATIAGIAGGYYASYSSLVCPTELGLPYTITLLIIIYLGGVGSLRGVMIGAILFTVLPELLRVTQEARLVIYGALLLLVAIYMPDGVEGAVRGMEERVRRRKATVEPGSE
jgi:branched-chain amino acid transport system permease protein